MDTCWQSVGQNYRSLNEARRPATVPSTDPVESVDDSSFTDLGTCQPLYHLAADTVRADTAFDTGRETSWDSQRLRRRVALLSKRAAGDPQSPVCGFVITCTRSLILNQKTS